MALITEIGIVAGSIWHYLEEHGEVSLSDMVENIDKPRDMILMSLGWLAREGHVVVESHAEDFKVRFRKDDAVDIKQ